MLHFTEKNILLIILIFCSGLLYSQTATITLNSENQVIRGFGGINHPEWYSDLNAAERELAFGNGAGQLGLTVLRTYVSENTNNWGLGIQTAQYAYNQGAYVFASPWNPPAEMTITVDGVKRINPASFSAYAEHLNSYVTYMRNQGVELYAISTQNEPDYAHDWTEWSPQESVDFIKAYADRIDCRLMSPESFQYRKDVYDPILNDPAALANVDIFGAHLYGTQYADFPYPLFEQKGAGKELWMTEVYTDSQYDANLWNDGIINQDQHALKVAEHIHYAMVDGNFQTYVFWPIRRYYALIHDGNADGNGNTPAAAGTATKRGYCMAQFSKWVRPGYIRVDATKSPSTNVFVSAYKKDSDVVIVVVNKNTSTQSLTLDIPGTQVSSWEQYTTSATKNISQGNTINAGSSFQVTLDAASITTFVGNVQAGIPTVEITGPQENEQFIAPATIPVTSTATDSDGTIEHVDFYLNNETTPFHEEWTAPYDFNWDVPQAGTYQLRAVAYDNEGNSSEDIISIQVNIPQGPYNGTISTIPGTIEFEHFDVGGNGFAYYDVDAGTNVDPAPDFRTDEDVDIETCTDTDGGYNIGYTMAGEWLEYTVNAATSGTYDITFRVACEGDNRTISLDSDGTLLAENVAIPNTGGWQVWTDVTIENVELQAGEQILRLTIGDTDYVNLNYMSFSLQEEPPLTFELTSGWNLIGCPLEGSTNIETALQSVWDYVDMVK
ncbi:MAG: carbohydrate-binding protein, partial [Bacteroidales bacterium]|nr:carbohydrate-binding protein [Bacteroidales bacterium]